MERQKIHGEKEKHNNYGVYLHFCSFSFNISNSNGHEICEARAVGKKDSFWYVLHFCFH